MSHPGVKRSGTSLSDSALHHALNPTTQSSTGRSRIWRRSSDNDRDLEMGLITGSNSHPIVDENREEDDDASEVVEIPSTSRLPNVASNTTDPNEAAFNLNLLAAYLGINAENLQDKEESSQNLADDSDPQFEDMDSDDAIAAFIAQIDESLYPTPIKDPDNPFNNFQSSNGPGSLIGKQSIKALGMVLHTYETAKQTSRHLATWENYYYLRYMSKLFYSPDYRPLPKEFLRHLHYLLIFLKGSHEPKTPQQFLNFLKEMGGSSAVTVELAWVLLQYPLLLYNVEPRDPAMSFTEYISMVFPPSKRRREKFSIKLDDILEVGLKVEPTRLLGKHLTIKNRTVYVFCPHAEDMEPVYRYSNSRFARELGISTLGGEIFSSLFALYGHSAELTKLARDLHIKPEGKMVIFDFDTVLVVHEAGEPKVLAGRLDALEDLIARERVWWRSLLRDIKKRSQERPLEFWGSVFASLFSITVIIQTVTAVISCVYTVRQYQVSLDALPPH